MSLLAASLYCRASTGGLFAVVTSISQPYTASRPLFTANAPSATIDALAGGAVHCAAASSCGEPGVACGARLFDTISKMPAFVRSLKSVVSKTLFSTGVCGSPPAGLKSAAASRIR